MPLILLLNKFRETVWGFVAFTGISFGAGGLLGEGIVLLLETITNPLGHTLLVSRLRVVEILGVGEEMVVLLQLMPSDMLHSVREFLLHCSGDAPAVSDNQFRESFP